MAEEILEPVGTEEVEENDSASEVVDKDDFWLCNCPICRVFVNPLLSVMVRAIDRRVSKSHPSSLVHQIPGEVEASEEIIEENVGKTETIKKFIERAKKENVEVKTVKLGESKEVGSEESVDSRREEESSGEEEERQVDLTNLPQLANVLERIEAIEEEVQSLKNNIANTIEGIKATLVDLRAAVAEVSNPFNIMRKYAELLGFGAQQVHEIHGPQPQQTVQQPEQIPVAVTASTGSTGGAQVLAVQGPPRKQEDGSTDELEKIQKSDLFEDQGKEDVKSLEEILSSTLNVGESEEKAIPEKKEENDEKSDNVESSEDVIDFPSLGGREGLKENNERYLEDSLQSIVLSKSAKKLGLGKLIRLVKWIDAMLEKMPENAFEQIIRFASNIGLLDRDDMDLVLKTLSLVVKSREIGIRVDDQLIALYMLAKIFGVEDKEADSEIVKLAVNRDDILDKFIKP